MKNFTSISVSVLVTLAIIGCITPLGENVSTEDISTTVDTYMKLTLGSIPGANIDYERAKQYLTPSLATQFTTPMFIPASYCIQDGPSDVRVTSVTFDDNANMATARVEGAYHGGWIHLWNFTVVPVEGDDWMIHMITCSDEMQ
jgi:hypothetical protein